MKKSTIENEKKMDKTFDKKESKKEDDNELSKIKEASYFKAKNPYTEIGTPSSYRDAIEKLNDF